jgi:hypothetical protein
MDEQQRRQIVLDSISENQGFPTEWIFQSVENHMSRGTFFRILTGLKKDQLVTVQKDRPNSRDNKLYVDSNNLLILIPRELEEFEGAFFILLENAKKKFDQQYLSIKYDSLMISSRHDPPDYTPILPLMRKPLFMFHEMVNVIVLRAMALWPLKIQNKEILAKLFTIVFTKIASMRSRISEIYRFTLAGDMDLMLQDTILDRLYATETMIENMETFSRFGLQTEIERVSDSLWNIYRDYKRHSFPEPYLYGWNFNYENDDWRKLMNIQKKFPDQTYRNYIKDSIE